jgi:hypothetical protein
MTGVHRSFSTTEYQAMTLCSDLRIRWQGLGQSRTGDKEIQVTSTGPVDVTCHFQAVNGWQALQAVGSSHRCCPSTATLKQWPSHMIHLGRQAMAFTLRLESL